MLILLYNRLAFAGIQVVYFLFAAAINVFVLIFPGTLLQFVAKHTLLFIKLGSAAQMELPNTIRIFKVDQKV